MNIGDDPHRLNAPLIAPADTALAGLVEHVRISLGLKKPEKVLVYSLTTRAGRAFIQIELLDVSSGPVKYLAWKAYAELERPESVVSALQNLAIYGCRGDELAFSCKLPEDERYRYWLLIDPVSMQPRITADGKTVRGEDFLYLPSA